MQIFFDYQYDSEERRKHGFDGDDWGDDDEMADAPPRAADEEGEEDADDAPCERCGVTLWEEGNEILLCDGEGCGKAYHMLCLPRPLASVPEGDWLCPSCSTSQMI